MLQGGGEVLRDGQPQPASVGQGERVLDQALAELPGPDEGRGPAVVVQRAGKDLGCRGCEEEIVIREDSL